MIAQALLESDWGKSTLSRAPYNNLFGIQGSYNGNCVYMKTQEYINGRYVEKVMPFRKYPSLAESFADNAHVLKTTNFGNGYYYAETWRANASTYQQATSALTGKYATDPNYGNSLNNIIQRYNLTQYDGTGNVSPASSNSQNNVQPSSAQIYTVRSGDSLWSISQKYNVSINQIKALNNLRSDMIYVGQTLIVSKTASSAPSRPTPTPAANHPSSSIQTHKVVSGDSLWKLSHIYGASIQQLRTWNHLNSYIIYIGQTLRVR